ncbi:MAG: vWA domain-containing protein, partial [Pseudomonadota bacterium]
MSRGKRRGSLLPVAFGLMVIGFIAAIFDFGGQAPGSGTSADALTVRTADQATKAAFSWAGTLSTDGLAQTEGSVLLDDNRVRRNYVLAIDASGSMADNDNCAPNNQAKFGVVRPAVEEFLRSLQPEDYLALMSFQSDNAQVLVPLGPVNPAQIFEAMASIVPNGGTPIGTTLLGAKQMLEQQAQRQAGYGEYTIVMVTDGAASDPERMTYALEQITLNTPIVIQTVGFCLRN